VNFPFVVPQESGPGVAVVHVLSLEPPTRYLNVE